MRGRAQAAVVALLGSWLPLISPAAVALVTLRRGSLDGSMILLWALCPALATFWLSDMGPLMPAATVLGLLAVTLAAQLLRNSSSWQQALFAMAGLGAFSGVLIGSVIPDPVAGVTQALGDLFAEIEAQQPQGTAMIRPTDTFVLGLIGYVVAVSALLSLLLARWWQAMLYNPGGFQAEFHRLRLHPVAALVCALAVVYCWNRGLDYQYWGSLFGLPLLVAGAALAHGVVKLRRMSGQWLIVFYLALAFAGIIVMVFAALDSWTDFRSRIRAAAPPDRQDGNGH
ncbi:hypothetical protein [Pseudomaricurvus sp. HS19]|uniref:hypothetical protein n=1 Tax=Pseudomaricurvus sp. HS19 TaxID=2692626 RepID=UPI0013709187|nr:hypothetical protein [Pseudomaricurvus sp. HS19]MYM63505.1 hypothetical protein [Pseudomaricurvus sp. HS19]